MIGGATLLAAAVVGGVYKWRTRGQTPREATLFLDAGVAQRLVYSSEDTIDIQDAGGEFNIILNGQSHVVPKLSAETLQNLEPNLINGAQSLADGRISKESLMQLDELPCAKELKEIRSIAEFYPQAFAILQAQDKSYAGIDLLMKQSVSLSGRRVSKSSIGMAFGRSDVLYRYINQSFGYDLDDEQLGYLVSLWR